MSPLSSMSPALLALPVLASFGYYSTMHILSTTGITTSIMDKIDSISYLPGTNAPLLNTYTSIPPLDNLLKTLAMLFWPTLDGGIPGHSVQAVHFAAQLGGGMGSGSC